MKYKKGAVTDYLPWILIAVAIIVIASIAAWAMSDAGVNLIDKIKGLFGG